jgi:TPR repeat protein
MESTEHSAEGAVRFYAESPRTPLRSRLPAGCGLTLVALAIAGGAGAATLPWDLGTPPAASDIPARLAWAGQQADTLRAQAARSPREARAGTLLAALSVVVAADMERAVSAGDRRNAAALRELLESKLGDAPLRLERVAAHDTGGADFALGVMALHGILGERNHGEACRRFESAWAAGFRLQAYRLSECLEATNPARSTALLRIAADSGDAAAAESLGRSCMAARPGDLACASKRIAAAAAAGRPSAKSLLGWMYAQGVGVPAEPARALALYTEAAVAGDLSALNNLGELHETGRGVPADPARAAAYYREAAESGFAPGQFNFGRMLATGAGVARDRDTARTWLRAALKGGIEPAQKVLDWLDAQPAAPR